MADIDDLLDDLRQRRDELRVRMHLASKEAEEEWEELEKKLREFSRKAELDETGQGVGRALDQLGRELKAGYDRLRKALNP